MQSVHYTTVQSFAARGLVPPEPRAPLADPDVFEFAAPPQLAAPSPRARLPGGSLAAYEDSRRAALGRAWSAIADTVIAAASRTADDASRAGAHITFPAHVALSSSLGPRPLRQVCSPLVGELSPRTDTQSAAVRAELRAGRKIAVGASRAVEVFDLAHAAAAAAPGAANFSSSQAAAWASELVEFDAAGALEAGARVFAPAAVALNRASESRQVRHASCGSAHPLDLPPPFALWAGGGARGAAALAAVRASAHATQTSNAEDGENRPPPKSPAARSLAHGQHVPVSPPTPPSPPVFSSAPAARAIYARRPATASPFRR